MIYLLSLSFRKIYFTMVKPKNEEEISKAISVFSSLISDIFIIILIVILW